MEHLYALYYAYFPRFMTEFYEFRHGPAGGGEPDLTQPPGPMDYLLEISFFNFFSIPLFYREKRYDSKTKPD